MAGQRTRVQAALTTAPERMHLVHTLKLLTLPLCFARTFWRLGIHLLRVLLWAWLTLLPVVGPFPHMSHLAAMAATSVSV